MAQPILEYSFTGTANGAAAEVFGPYVVTISGTFSGTVLLEASSDAGSTYVTVARDTAGNGMSYTAPVSQIYGEAVEEAVLYRFRCSAYTSGTINARLAQATIMVPGQRKR